MMYQLRSDHGGHSIWLPGKCVCVARNYAAHAAELSSEVPTRPTFFIKPNSALTDFAGPLQIPSGQGAVHHELELALVVGRRLSRPEQASLDAVAGYCLAIDLTLRDVQNELKLRGLPWEACKAFAGSCPVTPLLPAAALPDPAQAELQFSVNGEIRQRGHTGQMVFGIERLLGAAAAAFVLEPGDLLLTGTPEGVGPLHPGDRFEASVNGLSFPGEVAL